MGHGARGRPLVALNAGATNSRAKCWPEERFAALADRLVAELGAEVVLIGAAAERESAARVIAGMRAPGAVNLAGETSVSELSVSSPAATCWSATTPGRRTSRPRSAARR